MGLAACVAAFAALVWPQWLHDGDLAHGIFLPFLAVILAVESRRDACPRFLRPGFGPLAACALLMLAGFASLAVAVAYAAAMGWSHAMAEFMASAALVFALAAAWLGLAERRIRFLPLNWAAGVAVILWLFASPPPPGTYARLSSFLQAEVTHGVVWALSAAGIAAFQQGNVIELARTSVGVSEACSGVRSLISCTVAGLFLSAILVRKPAHRALVIAVSPAIGLAMNFLRSLFLTLLANAGVDIEGRWHDLTGASILVATTLLVAAFAFRLHRLEPATALAHAAEPPPPMGRSPLPGIVAAGLVLAAVTGAVLATAGRAQRAEPASEPNLAALLPEAPPGWTVQTTPNFDQYSGILHTHALIERVYSDGPSPDSAHVTLYIAYWRPGQAPVSLVDTHTPDACWPGSGWVAQAGPSGRQELSIGGRRLAPAESRLFAHGTFETSVWFWHLYGGRPITFVDPRSVGRLLGLAWRYGFGPAKDQMFVRVSSDRPWGEIASQPVLGQFFENMRPLGL
jgi:exosortase